MRCRFCHRYFCCDTHTAKHEETDHKDLIELRISIRMREALKLKLNKIDLKVRGLSSREKHFTDQPTTRSFESPVAPATSPVATGVDASISILSPALDQTDGMFETATNAGYFSADEEESFITVNNDSADKKRNENIEQINFFASMKKIVSDTIGYLPFNIISIENNITGGTKRSYNEDGDLSSITNQYYMVYKQDSKRHCIYSAYREKGKTFSPTTSTKNKTEL